jgi:uncharacterized coiled-coil protein SlyX
MKSDDLNRRLERIEAHLAHVERLHDDLNEVVVEQAGLLKKLQTQLRRVSNTVETAELERIRATNPKPPHYQ